MNIKGLNFSYKNSTFPSSVCDTGQMKEVLDVLDWMVTRVEENTISKTCMTKLDSKQKIKTTTTDSQSCMVESQHKNKRKISQDKSMTSNVCTQNTTGSLRMSDQVLTSTVKDCKPFWDSYTKEWSEKLSSSIPIDLQELEKKSWTTSLATLAQNSWFTVKVKKIVTENMTTCSRLSRCLWRAIMENVRQATENDEKKKNKREETKRRKLELENAKRKKMKEMGMSEEHQDDILLEIEKVMELEEKLERGDCNKIKIRGLITRSNNAIKRIEGLYEEKVSATKKKDDYFIRAKKVKVKPKKDEKKILDDWFDASRFVYNQCVEKQKHEELDVMRYGVSNEERKRFFRDYIKDEVMVKEENSWLKSVHNVIIDGAILDFVKAYKTNVEKWKKKKKKNEDFKFKLHYRSKARMQQETIHINARDWTQKSGSFSFLKKVKAYEELPQKLYGELNVSRTRIGHYYYSILSKSEKSTSSARYSIIALDPGERTFQTGYDVNGMTVEWGDGDKRRFYALQHYADKLQSKWSKETNSWKKNRQKRAWHKMLIKIRNKVNECQRKLVSFLSRCYSIILLPEYKTSLITRKGTRKIGKKTSRNIYTWAHYRFRELLKAKVNSINGCELIICDEAYTSKTCGKCGTIVNIGSSKTFKCTHCQFRCDRDVNGARNILLRFLRNAKVPILFH